MSTIGHNSRIGIDSAATLVLGDEDACPFHYVSWHINDYMAGTAGMTLELEGAYQRFLMRLYQRGKPLPDNDRFMSTIMALTLRVWKRLRGALIDAGKIIARAGSLTNSRFEKERQKRAEQLKNLAAGQAKRRSREKSLPQVSGKFAPSLAETSPKLSPNVVEKVNEIKAAAHTPGPESRIQNPISNYSNLLDRLCDAAGASIVNPAGAPALLQIGAVNGWIDQGCDLERDILPAIKARAARAAPGTIRSWSYFTQAVADAKAQRAAPLPRGVKKAAPIDREKAISSSFLQTELRMHQEKMRG